MLRYLRRLSDMDLALDRTMIPLGSCTMKLNATTEMEAVTWPEFAGLHPFAPVEDAAGLLELIDQLSDWLCEITGYAAVSLQPNAGSQGELAGLLAIRAYHRSRGDEGRTVCLIPASAHGTNAASRGDGRDEGRRRRHRHRRQHRHGRPAREDRQACRRAGRDHGHLPVDARRLRGHHHRTGGRDPRRRRPGLRRRGEPERAGRGGPAGAVRRRRLAPEPAQDVLHPARRRWSRRRAGRGARAPGAVPAEPPAGPLGRTGDRCRCAVRGALGIGVDPADQLGVHPDDGRRRVCAGRR